jgi:uncharacterized protein YuzE
VNHQKNEPVVKYYPDTETLCITNGRPIGEGDDVCKDVVAFFDKENPSEVVGLTIECAEAVLKPFVEAILAKHGVTKADTNL